MNSQSIKDFKLLLAFVVLIWLIELINIALNHNLNQYGLLPRDLGHLYGVVTMHFLHGGLYHLIANTIPLIVLGFLVCATNKGKEATLAIMLLTGIMVWIFARSAFHVGASGLVMGYFGFLLGWAYFNRNIKNIILALVTVFLYGGLAFSLLDFRSWVSFEGHIFGFASGIVTARLLVRKRQRKTKK